MPWASNASSCAWRVAAGVGLDLELAVDLAVGPVADGGELVVTASR